MNTHGSNYGALLSLITIGATFVVAIALCF